ncbi:uncharacterized protein A4U43_C05F32540 [Asparagus officinalis]|uniref:Uncharacterized protein n=1 Tax=Asparagus officinalis TaxID=4686 RepID=A0A5P1EXY5_ASPOF|nr:uncharacterized protein A4U43_C05F32540 [Asparagus officinalis]
MRVRTPRLWRRRIAAREPVVREGQKELKRTSRNERLLGEEVAGERAGERVVAEVELVEVLSPVRSVDRAVEGVGVGVENGEVGELVDEPERVGAPRRKPLKSMEAMVGVSLRPRRARNWRRFGSRRAAALMARGCGGDGGGHSRGRGRRRAVRGGFGAAAADADADVDIEAYAIVELQFVETKASIRGEAARCSFVLPLEFE